MTQNNILGFLGIFYLFSSLQYFNCQFICLCFVDFYSGILMNGDTVITLRCHVINRLGFELWTRQRKCAGEREEE